MTDREKAIVMAYTGVTMLIDDKLDIFYKYLAELFGRPVFTHELAMDEMEKAIKEKSYADFIKLCRETTDQIRHGHWIEKEYNPSFHTYICSVCEHGEIDTTNYCSNCGAKMDGGDI